MQKTQTIKTIIDKEFHWEAGHRVWSQTLDTKYTHRGDSCCACRHLHGHSYRAKILLEETIPGDNIKDTGMVLDFKMIGFMKDFIDDVLDHKMLFDINDPLLQDELPRLFEDNKLKNVFKIDEYFIPDLNKLGIDLQSNEEKDKAVKEKYEGIVLVDFIPTSENIAGWLLRIAANKLKDLEHVKVTGVELWETPKSHVKVLAQ